MHTSCQHLTFTKYLVQSINISWTWYFHLNVLTWQLLVSIFWISTNVKEVSFTRWRTKIQFCVPMTTCFQCSVFPKIALHYLWTNDGILFCCQTFNRLKTRHGLEVSSFVQILVTYGHGKHLRTSIYEKPKPIPPFYFLVIKFKSSILTTSLKYCGKGKVLDVLKLP